jgi:hypothetical protein
MFLRVYVSIFRMFGPYQISHDPPSGIQQISVLSVGKYNLHSIAILLFDISYKNDMSLPTQKFTNLLCSYYGWLEA